MVSTQNQIHCSLDIGTRCASLSFLNLKAFQISRWQVELGPYEQRSKPLWHAIWLVGS